MTYATLETLCASLAGDPQKSRYSGKYTEALNLAQQQFALDTKGLWKDSTITIVAGTSAYSLPSDFMWEKRVTHKQLPLDPISRENLEADRGTDWTLDTGKPQKYIIDPEEGRKTITLWPNPTADDEGGNTVLTYYPLPADMDDNADIPLNASALMAQFHIGLAAWGAWLLNSSETDMTPSLGSRMANNLTTYNNAVTKCVDTFKNTASEPLQSRGPRSNRRGI